MKELTKEEIVSTIRKQTIACEMVPVTCGSAYKNKGVQMMLDAVINFMPSPLDIPAIKGVIPGTEEEAERPASDQRSFVALAFKKSWLTHSLVSLHSSEYTQVLLAPGSYVYNSTKKTNKERIGRILQMHANKREEIDMVYSGDIRAE